MINVKVTNDDPIIKFELTLSESVKQNSKSSMEYELLSKIQSQIFSQSKVAIKLKQLFKELASFFSYHLVDSGSNY